MPRTASTASNICWWLSWGLLYILLGLMSCEAELRQLSETLELEDDVDFVMNDSKMKQKTLNVGKHFVTL